MSAHGHEMEREDSSQSQSLTSRAGSEMGSQYNTEAGIFMSSFAAAVFISGLVIVGVSLVSMLVALSLMLHDCESQSSGVLETHKYRNNNDYCRNFALHAELNSLGADSLPSICKDVDAQYIKEGQYRRDLNITVGMAEDFFNSVRPQFDNRDVVLMDVDDLSPETLFTHKLMYRVNADSLHGSSNDADYVKHIFVRKLYLKLQSGGWPLILFSRKPEKQRDATIEYLISVGCRGSSSLIMRKENEMSIDFQEFLSGQRTMLERDGFRIIAVISSQMDALKGPCLGHRVFKLPSPMFSYSMEHHVETQIQKDK